MSDVDTDHTARGFGHRKGDDTHPAVDLQPVACQLAYDHATAVQVVNTTAAQIDAVERVLLAGTDLVTAGQIRRQTTAMREALLAAVAWSQRARMEG